MHFLDNFKPKANLFVLDPYRQLAKSAVQQNRGGEIGQVCHSTHKKVRTPLWAEIIC